MIPVARIPEMSIQCLDNEVIIYDSSSRQSYHLNLVTAKVLELCDGKNTIQEIAHKIENILNLQSHPEIDSRRLV